MPIAAVRRAPTFIAILALVAAAVSLAAPARAATAVEGDGPVATPVSPVDGAILDRGDFDFRWSSPAGAASYELRAGLDGRVDADGALVTAPSTETIPTIAAVFTVAELPTGTYYWQVRAIGSDGEPGPWSAVRTVELSVPGDDGFQLETLGLDDYAVATPVESSSNSVVADRVGALAVVVAGGFSILLLAVVGRAWARARRTA